MTDDEFEEFGFAEVTTEEFLAKFGDFSSLDPADPSGTSVDTSESSVGAVPSRRSRRKRLVAILMFVAVAAAAITVGVLLMGDGGGDGDGVDAVGTATTVQAVAPDDSSGEPAVGVPGTTSAATGTTAGTPDGSEEGPDVVNPPGLDLPTRGLFDSFARADADGLGLTETGREWVGDSGSWGIRSRSAVITEPSTSGPTITIANMRATSGTVQVTMPSVKRGSGIVFRFKNTFNYWALTAAPDSGTWSVSKVIAGKQTQLGSIGLTQVADYTTIAVRFDETFMDFYVDGTKVAAMIDPDPIGGTYAGLIGLGPESADAQWTNFVVIAQAEPPSGT